MTILCELDEATAVGVSPGLGNVRRVKSLPEAAIAVAEDHSENLVVIGFEAPFDQALDFTITARRERPPVNVILIRDHWDPKAVTAALDAGVREVVPAGDPAAIVAACHRATAVPVAAQPSLADDVRRPHYHAAAQAPHEIAPPAPSVEGKVITVFSPKGGSGKTTIATNLAVALSEIAPPVCLVDLDLEFGDVAISLRLTPARTLADAVKMEVDGDEDDALALLTTEYKPGMNCILAPIEPGDAEKIPAELVSDLLALLRARYAFVVVDTPSQLSGRVLAALDSSDHHLLLTNPEVPALKNLRLTLDMLDLLHYDPRRRSVIFNRADASAGISAAEVEQTIHTPIAVHVPASRDVPASINRGVPLVAARKDHPVSVAISRFAADVLVGDTARAGRRSGRRIFGRRQA
jgi:pilus assembly protein CpaE